MHELIAADGAAQFDRVQAQCRVAAIEKWNGALPGDGNRALFQLGVDLRAAGMSDAEIEHAFELEAGNARHAAERRNEIKSIMRTLRASYRRLAA